MFISHLKILMMYILKLLSIRFLSNNEVLLKSFLKSIKVQKYTNPEINSKMSTELPKSRI